MKHKIKFLILFVTVAFCVAGISSCKYTAVLTIPERFTQNATRTNVKGLSKKHMGFGGYQTGKIKRRWDPSFSRRSGNLAQRYVENRLLRDFGITGNNIRKKQKGKFQYPFENEKYSAEIFGFEKKVTNHLSIRTNTDIGFLNNLSFLKNYLYIFTVSIFPEAGKYNEPWKLFISNQYRAATDTSRKFLEEATGNENGYATNGKDSIYIRAIFAKKAISAKGKESKMLVKRLAGYELKWEGGLVCFIDAVKRDVWIYNDLADEEKFMLAAISSAILLRRVQDIRD